MRDARGRPPGGRRADRRGPGTVRPDVLGLVGFASVVVIVASIGGLFATGSRSTYAELDLPDWAPPGWLFGPVWLVLYALIALAGWLAWRPGGFRGKGASFLLYGVQLVLNAAWTPLFFAAGAYEWALADIVLLWWAILATMLAFETHSRAAALLLLPYLVWVGYATALTATVQ